MAVNQRFETVSVVDAVTKELRDALFEGSYEAGQEIKDTRIANEFGIARPTARIAVQRLINEGMLVRPSGQSARVRTFDPFEVADLYRVRRLIELDAIREIKSRDLSLRGIERALGGFADIEGGEDWSRIAEADVAFHTAVVEAGGSARLQSYFAGIASETRLLIALLKAQYPGGAELYREHEELYEMLGGDTSQSELECAWVVHLDSAQRFLENYLST